MKIDKQGLLIVGQSVETFPSKLYAGMVQVPAMNLFNSLIPAGLNRYALQRRLNLRKATLPWPTAMRSDSLRAILQEN